MAGPPALYACLRLPQQPDVAIAVAKDFSPRLQRYPNGCVVLDVSGLERLLGSPQTIGEELAQAVCLQANTANGVRRTAVAVAPTQTAALLLAAAYSTLTVETGDVVAALTPISIQVLYHFLAEAHDVTFFRTKRAQAAKQQEQWERYEKAFDALRRWGIATLGALGALPAGELSGRLGQAGVQLQRVACGLDGQPLVPDADVPRFLQRIELEWPIDTLEPLSFVFARLLDPLSASLERADRGAAAIRLDLRLVDRTTHARLLQLPAAMRDPKVLRTLLVLDLESHLPSAAIDHVTIEVDPAPGRILQYSLLERARPSAETLATLTARLGALVGESRCGLPVLLDSHQPDAFELRRFTAEEPPIAGRGSPVDRAEAAIGDSRPANREPRSAAPLRRFRPPRAIRVSVERGRPVHVAIDRRGMPGGQVTQCAGPWRSSGAWWDRGGRHWNRDEWDVELGDGAVCRLFRERDTDSWFMDGILD
jgi:protein ImuB